MKHRCVISRHCKTPRRSYSMASNGLEALLLSIPGIRRTGPPPTAAAAVAPLSDDTPVQPPTKRAKRGGKADAAPQAAAAPPSLAPVAPLMVVQEPVSDVLLCPTSCVGFVIGKGGCNVKGVQQVTGASVQVAKQDEGGKGDEREITLNGLPAAVALARAMLEQMIAHAQARSSGGTRSRGIEQQSGEPVTEARLPCEASKVGWLIGPGGAHIKAVRALSGARVDVLDEVTATGARGSTVVLTGTAGQINDAKLALQGLIGAPNSVASKAYAEQLLQAAKQRGELIEAKQQQHKPVEIAPAGEAAPSAEQGAERNEASGWVRLTAKHPDGKEVGFWLHTESGMYSW